MTHAVFPSICYLGICIRA